MRWFFFLVASSFTPNLFADCFFGGHPTIRGLIFKGIFESEKRDFLVYLTESNKEDRKFYDEKVRPTVEKMNAIAQGFKDLGRAEVTHSLVQKMIALPPRCSDSAKIQRIRADSNIFELARSAEELVLADKVKTRFRDSESFKFSRSRCLTKSIREEYACAWYEVEQEDRIRIHTNTENWRGENNAEEKTKQFTEALRKIFSPKTLPDKLTVAHAQAVVIWLTKYDPSGKTYFLGRMNHLPLFFDLLPIDTNIKPDQDLDEIPTEHFRIR